jgi:hypothetical protein
MGFLATSGMRRGSLDLSAAGALLALFEIGLAVLLGVVAIAAAFDMSIPARRFRGGAVLAVGGVLWLVASIATIILSPRPIGHLGDGPYCYSFMLLASLPMILLLLVGLRRTRAVRPERTLAVSGLGIAFMAAGLLGFCHPPTGNMADFLLHLAAAGSIVALTMLGGKRWVRL